MKAKYGFYVKIGKRTRRLRISAPLYRDLVYDKTHVVVTFDSGFIRLDLLTEGVDDIPHTAYKIFVSAKLKYTKAHSICIHRLVSFHKIKRNEHYIFYPFQADGKTFLVGPMECEK